MNLENLKNYYETTQITKKIETIDSLLSKINIEKNSNISLEEIIKIINIDNHEIFVKCLKKWLKEQLNKDNNITLDI